MALLNYSASYITATPVPQTTNFYQSVLPPFQYQQQPQQGTYTYPRPPNPFLREEFDRTQTPKRYNQNNQETHYRREESFRTTPKHFHEHHQRYEPQNTVTEAPIHFTKVTPGGSKTRVHAVIDYDDDYYDDGGGESQGGSVPVAPIQGPIFIKNGSIPVVPLYSYPVVNNGTFVQIPVSSIPLKFYLNGYGAS